VSLESVKAVEDAIERYKPDTVAVELCAQRYQALKDEKRWDEMHMEEVIASDRMHLFLLQILLANFQRKIGDDVGVKPGAEMFKAIELAEARGIDIVLADRDIKVTLKRAMDQMTFMEKAKLLYGFIGGIIEGQEIDKELIEKLKEKDVLTELMEELAVETPSIKKVLIDERDRYIAERIHASEGKTIVAVVGAGHMQGIIENLNQLANKILVSYNSQMEGVRIQREPKKGTIKPTSLIFPLLLIALFGWVLMKFGAAGWGMIMRLFLLQGIGAAVGTAIAFGHPLSIIAAFLSAPFAALHPLIAVGWIAAYVELKVRKPRVMDFKNLTRLKSMRDYWNNRVVRLILIAALANLGSTLGSIVGIGFLGFSAAS